IDSLYMLTQTFIVFIFGSKSLVMMNSNINYLLSISVMVIFSLVFYRLLFQGENNNIYFLLLIGMILGTFFSSFTSFMQVLIDPNEFMVAQDKMFASVNNVNTSLVYLSILLIVLVVLYYIRFHRYLDVLALGKDQATNLGVPYNYVVKRLLIIVAIPISIATALIGPLTFLGLIVVNVAHEFMKTYRHAYIITAYVLISIIVIVGGQFIVEKILVIVTTISMIINIEIGRAHD